VAGGGADAAGADVYAQRIWVRSIDQRPARCAAQSSHLPRCMWHTSFVKSYSSASSESGVAYPTERRPRCDGVRGAASMIAPNFEPMVLMLACEPVLDRRLVGKAGHIIDLSARTMANDLPVPVRNLCGFENYRCIRDRETMRLRQARSKLNRMPLLTQHRPRAAIVSQVEIRAICRPIARRGELVFV
jgi:hypothetical protein